MLRNGREGFNKDNGKGEKIRVGNVETFYGEKNLL